MVDTAYDKLRAAFLRAFASVPDSLRSEIIAVVDGKPFTWESSYVEVKGGTEKSKKILNELKKLEIIS